MPLYEANLTPSSLVLTSLPLIALPSASIEHYFASTYVSITAFAVTLPLAAAAAILRILTGRDFG